MLIDTHCHLTSTGLIEQVGEVVGRAREAGVTRMILVAVNPQDARVALELLESHPELHLVVGLHPHEALKWDDARRAEVCAILGGDGIRADVRRRIVGIGETGLDFHYDFAPHTVQEHVFRAHLDIALAFDLPVVIHARESEARVCDILDDYPSLAGRVVFHCYSGDADLTRRILAAGNCCSFTGVVTFGKAESIRESARRVPRDRIMVETDAPYLAPEPMRKIRPNEPALLVHTARFLADLRGEDFAVFAAATTANAERFFRLPPLEGVDA
jgi:TatD DNase family protein